MRTTLNIPDDLVNEGLKIGKFKTKTGLIVKSLQDYIYNSRITKLKEFRGKVNLDIDIEDLRKR